MYEKIYLVVVLHKFVADIKKPGVRSFKKIKADPIWQAIQANEQEYTRLVKFAEKFVRLDKQKLPATWNDKKDLVTHLKEAGVVNAEQIDANLKNNKELWRTLCRKYPELAKQKLQSSFFLLK